MKLRELQLKVATEIKNRKEERAIKELMKLELRIEEAQRVVTMLKDKKEELLEKDVNDIDIHDFEY